MSDHPPIPRSDTPEPTPPPEGRIIQVSEWLQGQREVWIEHDGVRYRLRVTRRNRLILQK